MKVEDVAKMKLSKGDVLVITCSDESIGAEGNRNLAIEYARSIGAQLS